MSRRIEDHPDKALIEDGDLWLVQKTGDSTDYKVDPSTALGKGDDQIPRNSDWKGELADTTAGKGAALVKYEDGVTVQERLPVDNLKALVDATALQVDGLQVQMRAFYSDTDTGGGHFYWDSDRAKSDANGVTIVDPDNIGSLTATALGTTYYTQQGTGSGTGCWVRVEGDAAWTFRKAGIRPENTVAENDAAIAGVISGIPDPHGLLVEPGLYDFTGIEVTKNITFYSESVVAAQTAAGTKRVEPPNTAPVIRVAPGITTDVKKLDGVTDEIAGIWFRGSSTDTGFNRDQLFRAGTVGITIEFSATHGNRDNTPGVAVLHDDSAWSRNYWTDYFSYGDGAVRTINDSWLPHFHSIFTWCAKVGTAWAKGSPSEVRNLSLEHDGNGGLIDGVSVNGTFAGNTAVFVTGLANDEFRIAYMSGGLAEGSVGVHVHESGDTTPDISSYYPESSGGTALVVEGVSGGTLSGARVMGGEFVGGNSADPAIMVQLIAAKNVTFFGTSIFNNVDSDTGADKTRVEIDSDSSNITFYNCKNVTHDDTLFSDNSGKSRIVNENDGSATKGLNEKKSITVGTSGTYGASTSFNPGQGFNSLIVQGLRATLSGISSETITVKAIFRFSDGTNFSSEYVSETSDGTYFGNQEGLFLSTKSSVHLSRVDIQAKTSAASTSATVDASVAAVQC